MFQVTLTDNHNATLLYPALNMHWAVLLLPSLLLQIGPLMIVATVLEFIDVFNVAPTKPPFVSYVILVLLSCH